jgi:hypothetical protein
LKANFNSTNCDEEQEVFSKKISEEMERVCTEVLEERTGSMENWIDEEG